VGSASLIASAKHGGAATFVGQEDAQQLYQSDLANHHNSNSFFLIPVFHFPWSEKGREERIAAKAERDSA